MGNLFKALQFVSSFSSGDVDGLGLLITDDFHLKGPLFEFASKQAYLDSLAHGGLERAGHRVISATETDDSVSVYYEYLKADGTITIAQLFTFRDGLIADSLVVFDTAAMG
jgi:hypothetical protein